jgi:transcriptional regulator with XRE-family HTH domain
LDTYVSGFDRIMDTVENNLVDLITQFSETTGLSYRQMSIRAGLGESTVAIVVRGDRKAGFDFCLAISGVLKIRPEEALRLAGLLPPLPAAVEEEQEIVHTIRKLPPHDRSVILRALSGLVAEATPPQLTPGPAQGQEEEREHRQVLGDAVLHLEHPVRQIYETLYEILPPEQFRELVIRLHQRSIYLHDSTDAREDDGQSRPDVELLPWGGKCLDRIDV